METARDRFLPDAGTDGLGALHKKETNAKDGGRLLAHMARKDGGSMQAVARNSYEAPGTIYGQPAGATDGPDDAKRPGVLRRPAAGRPAGPGEDTMTGPQRHGLGSGMWTGTPPPRTRARIARAR